MFDKQYDSGISPVIAVVLIVAIVVALVALVTVVVFNIGGDVSDSPDATVNLEQTSNGIQATVLRNENVEQLTITGPNGFSQTISSDPGTTKTFSGIESGDYSIIANVNGGESQVLQTVSITEDLGLVSGTVSFNPPAEGVKIKSFDSSDNLVDSDTTDKSGSFAVEEADRYTVGKNERIINLNPDANNDVDLNTVAGRTPDNVPDLMMNGDGSKSDPYIIETASDIQAMDEDLDSSYNISKDIDASHARFWNSGQGFKPIGSNTSPFTGTLQGNQNTISSLQINRSSEDYIGLFSSLDGNAKIKNFTMVDTTIKGRDVLGAISGRAASSNIELVGASGEMRGRNRVGGIVGKQESSGSISQSYATGKIIGTNKFVGGITGINNGSISQSYATGEVIGTNNFVGGTTSINNGIVQDAYIIGQVKANNKVGGIAAVNNNIISDTYGVGEINIDQAVSTPIFATLVAQNTGTVEDSYSNAISSSDPTVNGGTENNIDKFLDSDSMNGNDAKTNLTELDYTGEGNERWEVVESPTEEYPILSQMDRSIQLNNRPDDILDDIGF